ncbi:hypothetical protein [Fluviicola chungangensis]|uniref:Uncharacterized protein n=1 Tax=Fluviicola chungangensis TaxID=2597671 RepID=A0A556MMU2_9FLAO|nr:hypothetical protein [Fluviicola chungangensis]TSJ41260.1 hypothetical protein FO442_15225 [Fluviicola chungangensis]
MINSKEAQAMLVDVCTKVIGTLSEENNIEKTQLNIRIDLEFPTAKPVFALFNQTKFVKPSDLNTIINAGGGKGMGMIVGMYVRDVIKNIFVSSMKEFQVNDTKELFLLLYVKQEDQTAVPYIAIYKQGIKLDALPVAQLIGIG